MNSFPPALEIIKIAIEHWQFRAVFSSRPDRQGCEGCKVQAWWCPGDVDTPNFNNEKYNVVLVTGISTPAGYIINPYRNPDVRPACLICLLHPLYFPWATEAVQNVLTVSSSFLSGCIW